jgi:23S rRNA (guanine745-N1)-methyltransferase
VLEDVVHLLACPICGEGLALAGGSPRVLRCARGHAFDVARQGHVTLLTGDAPPGGDTSAMVAAREAFIEAGHMAPVVEGLGAAAEVLLAHGPPGAVVDLGAGTGHHLARVLGGRPERAGLALDRSPAAARRAVAAHPRIGAVVCDVWRGLPVRSGAAALAVNVFAPRNGPEIRRVLHDDGALIVVSPTGRHLAELEGPLGLLTVDPLKAERLAATLEPHLEPVASHEIEHRMRLSHRDLLWLVAMGPSARHLDSGTIAARVAALPEAVEATLSVTVAVHRPRRESIGGDGR